MLESPPWSNNILPRIWPFLIILLVVLIFFYPVWLRGLIPLPGDFIVGTYYPWLDYKWGGYGAGVPVKNPITTDVVSFIFPMQMLAVDQLKQGIIPLWNNLILTGTPLLANFQSAPFSPTNFLYFVLPKLTAWSVQIMGQPLLATIFLYWLLREFGRSKLASIAGGLFFAFGGFMTIWLEWNGHSLVAAFFPLIIFLTIKWIKLQQVWWGIFLSVALGLQIFSGYPQIILYELLAVIPIIFIVGGKQFLKSKRLMWLVFFLGLGVGLAAIQVIPGLELMLSSQRKVEGIVNVSAFLPWQYLITFLAPDYFGNHVTGNFWGEGDYTLVTGFSGVVVILLAILGSLTMWKEKLVKLGISFTALSLLIVLPNPLTLVLKESGFLGLQAASAHRALVLSNLGFVILAAFGIDALLLAKIKIRDLLRSVYIPAILLLGFGMGTYVAIWWLNNYSAANRLTEAIKVISNLRVGLKNLVLPASYLSGATVLILASLHFKKWHKVLTIWLIILATFELFRFGWKFTPFSPKEFIYPSTPVLEFLQSQPKPFRVAAEDVVPINMMMSYKVETLEGYDAEYPLTMARYLSALNSGQVGNTPQGRYGSIINIDSPLLDLANAKYILALKRDKGGHPDEKGQLPKKFQMPFLRTVFEDKTVVVLENTRALPRAFFVNSWETIKDDQQVLQSLLAKKIPLSEKVILEDDWNNFAQSVISNTVVKYLKDTADIKEFEVTVEKDGFLFISDNFYPGWKVRVDGLINPPVFKANYTFRAIPIGGSGRHDIKLSYQPDSFEWGKMISFMSGVILAVLFAVTKIHKKSNVKQS